MPCTQLTGSVASMEPMPEKFGLSSCQQDRYVPVHCAASQSRLPLHCSYGPTPTAHTPHPSHPQHHGHEEAHTRRVEVLLGLGQFAGLWG